MSRFSPNEIFRFVFLVNWLVKKSRQNRKHSCSSDFNYNLIYRIRFQYRLGSNIHNRSTSATDIDKVSIRTVLKISLTANQTLLSGDQLVSMALIPFNPFFHASISHNGTN